MRLPALLIFTACWLLGASLQTVSELDLRKSLWAGKKASLKVQSLAFSPDGKQLLVVTQDTAAVFRMENTNAPVARFQRIGFEEFAWSPDGAVFDAGPRVTHLTDGAACDLPRYSLWQRFLTNDLMVVRMPGDSSGARIGQPRPTELGFYDTQCHPLGSWTSSEDWGIIDSSPERGLLSVTVLGSRASAILDANKRQVLQRSATDGTFAGKFAESGHSICTRTCVSVDDARPVGKWPASVGSLAAVSSQSSRLVYDDYHPSDIPFSSLFTESKARRKVWDFRSGQELLSWPLRFLTYSVVLDFDGYDRDRRPVPCAISPNGLYLAEGGDGKALIYRIQP